MASANRPSAPPVRRIVTGHSPDGKAIVLEDCTVDGHTLDPNSTALFTGIHRHEEFPANNTDTNVQEGTVKFVDLIRDKPKELISPGGSVLWAVEMAPHSKSPWHRTISLDYGIMMSGSVTLVLDDDKRVTLHPGDVVVQRGTIHEWINDSDEWTRMFFTMIASEKVKIGDKELEMEFH